MSQQSHIYAFNETNRDFVRINAKGNDLTVFDSEAVAHLSNIAINTSGTGSTSNVNITNDSLVVTGDFYPETQPVSGDFYPLTQPVSGDFYLDTQPVSGSVTVNTISGFATETKLQEVNVKLSTGSGDVASGTEIQRILAYGLNGQGVKHPLDVDANGHLKITQQDRDIQRANVAIATEYDGTAMTSFPDGKKSAMWDSENYDSFKIYMAGTAGTFMGSLILQGSNTDADGDYVDVNDMYESGFDNVNYFYSLDIEKAHFRYYRLKNAQGSAVAFSSITVNFVK
jgi:hypothetical protein